MASCGFVYQKYPAVEALPSVVKAKGDRKECSTHRSSLPFCNLKLHTQNAVCSFQNYERTIWCERRRNRTVLVSASNAESNPCEFITVETPLKLRSSAGLCLSSVMGDFRHFFYDSMEKLLHALAADRDEALARKKQSMRSLEPRLQRRIAEIKENDCQIAIEEIIYVLIAQKFYEIKVPMISRLSTYIQNDTTFLWESKNKELESVHNLEVLDILKRHCVAIFDNRELHENTDDTTITPIYRSKLSLIYTSSIYFSYFLKSALLRHRLELNLALTRHDHPSSEEKLENLVNIIIPVLSTRTRTTSMPKISTGHERKEEKLWSYINQFDPRSLETCSKLKSREVANLVLNHVEALFSIEKEEEDENDLVFVTFCRLKRLVLEAFTFGSFLWDAENYVDSVYRLRENNLD